MIVTDELRNKYHLFWGGEFSQWYKSKFYVDNVEYNCAEQYMMASKARLFNDMITHRKIMQTSDPRSQKALGRNVENFNKEVWEQNAKLYVYRANLAKFTQDPDLIDFIMRTKDKTIVEASPHDKIWGIGLAENDDRCYFPDQWLGTNWLGEVLMAVREDIRALFPEYNDEM